MLVSSVTFGWLVSAPVWVAAAACIAFAGSGCLDITAPEFGGDAEAPAGGGFETENTALPGRPVPLAIAGNISDAAGWIYYTPDIFAQTPLWIDAMRNLAPLNAPIAAFAAQPGNVRAGWVLYRGRVFFNPRLDDPQSKWELRFDGATSTALPAGGSLHVEAMQTNDLQPGYLALLVGRANFLPGRIADDRVYVLISEDHGRNWRSAEVARSFSLFDNNYLRPRAFDVCAVNGHVFVTIDSISEGGSIVGALHVSRDGGRSFARVRTLFGFSGVESTPLNSSNCNVWTFEEETASNLSKFPNEDFARAFTIAGLRTDPVTTPNRLKSFDRSYHRMVFAPGVTTRTGTIIPSSPAGRALRTTDAFNGPSTAIALDVPEVTVFDLVNDGTASRIVVASRDPARRDQLVFTSANAGTSFVNRTGPLEARICAFRTSCLNLVPIGVAAQ